jgi:hypothetical protein
MPRRQILDSIGNVLLLEYDLGLAGVGRSERAPGIIAFRGVENDHSKNLPPGFETPVDSKLAPSKGILESRRKRIGKII